ncbi:hypothetical protein JAAARDRAFT_63292 [Jaapia argillacea MUCL 33604]|uniref:F-box domain-containing protein n=1 Tax=Jaapia argillacea MUCL 33604 TaxID=933084 RepID=A0A067P615_9AGAM|nr:hypothetical protein JAAARDRAFT_63292 [Jaapia argillacea MUCL 33604]
MAHHPVLHDPDLFRRIFEACALSSSYASTLLSVALCCRLWRHSALDILWRDLDSVSPLLNLLGSVEVVDGVYHPHRDISIDEWNSLEPYATRVRTLALDEHIIHPSLYTRMVELAQGKPLLPLLRALKWEMPLSQNIAGVLLFASSSIHEVCIFDRRRTPSPSFDKTLSVFLSGLSARAPYIRTLHSCVKMSSSLSMIPGLRSLQTLVIDDVDFFDPSTFFHRVVDLPNLSSLTVCVDGLRLTEPIHRVLLPFLVTLKLKGDGERTTRALETFTSPALTELTLYRASGPGVQCRRFSEVATQRFGLSLRKVSIFWDIMALPTDVTHDRTFHLFEPLLSISTITAFSITMASRLDYPGLSLSEDECHLVASSWPKLEHITIAYPGRNCAPQVTFGSLVSFALLCPSLKRLGLSFDTSRLPGINEVPELGHKLEFLSTDSELELGDLTRMVDLLHRIFANVKVIYAGRSHIAGVRASWSRVNAELRTLRR